MWATNSIGLLLQMNEQRRILFYHYANEGYLASIRTIQDENDWAMSEIVWSHSENDWAYNKNGWPLLEFVWPHDENEWPKFKIGWSIDENECLLTKLKWHMLVPLLWRRNWSLPLMNLKRKPANMDGKTYSIDGGGTRKLCLLCSFVLVWQYSFPNYSYAEI